MRMLAVLHWQPGFEPLTHFETFWVVFADPRKPALPCSLSSSRKHDYWEKNGQETVVFIRLPNP